MINDDELVSVIMPTHNAGKYLKEAVASILNQENISLELILVDDHSTDDAIFDLPKELKSDSRFEIVSSKTRGVVAAMATGYKCSQGKYIARMDADDISLPHRLYKQLHYLQQYPEIDIVGGQVKIISESSVEEGFVLYEKWLNQLCSPKDIAREIFIESPIPNPTAFFRRETYELLNGYQDPEWAEDYDMWLRADALGIKMGKPSGVVLHWREHQQRLTHNDRRYANKLFMKAKGYYLSHSDYLKQRKAIIWGAGPIGAQLYDTLIEQNVEVEAFLEVNPRKIGGRKRGVPVLHFSEIKHYNESEVLIIAAVGSRGARSKIRKALLDMGKEEGNHFLFAA